MPQVKLTKNKSIESHALGRQQRLLPIRFRQGQLFNEWDNLSLPYGVLWSEVLEWSRGHWYLLRLWEVRRVHHHRSSHWKDLILNPRELQRSLWSKFTVPILQLRCRLRKFVGWLPAIRLSNQRSWDDSYEPRIQRQQRFIQEEHICFEPRWLLWV
jgi:hypothetical protein